jgi:hypothetical protein
VAFRREPGEELPLLLFRLQGLALDMEKPLKDKELVGKFVASLDRRLAEQTNTQAMASTVETGGAYSLEEAYDAALMVSAGNARLKIARELAPRTAEVSRPRWGSKPAAAHAATMPEAVQMVAAPVAMGGSGACHNCGEVGHYRNGCPHPKRNSSGRNTGAGGRGGGRGRECYVCGDPGHLAAQCSKRVVPVAAAAVASQSSAGVSEAEFAEFQAWKARYQAAAATCLRDAEEQEDEDEWDDEEYAIGAVALPCGREGGPVMAAAGTKAGAEKARATRAAKKGEAAAGPLHQTGGAAAGGVAQQMEPGARDGGPRQLRPRAGVLLGTAQIAGPVDQTALEALRGRRDKAAAKERRAKLLDHGRNVAPQGLNRLARSFNTVAHQQQAPSAPTAENARVEVPDTAAVVRAVGLSVPVTEVSPGSALSGEVTPPVLTFLELAQGAGLTLAAVAAMARGGGAVGQLTPPIRLPAEGAGLARAGRGPVGLSPIAARARAARVQQESQATEAQGGGSPGEAKREVDRQLSEWRAEAERVAKGDQGASAGQHTARAGLGGQQEQGSILATGGGGVERSRAHWRVEPPESSAMGAARGALSAVENLARELAAQEGVVAGREESAACISRDAEFAHQLMAQDAAANGVSKGEALRAQAGPAAVAVRGNEEIDKKGKAKVGSSMPTDEEQAATLEWEKRLSAGAWRGSEELAPLVVQPPLDPVVMAAARAQAMACFAQGRPLVSPRERNRVEGVPDWIDNFGKVVKVMTAKGWWAPERVLLDGGSYYSMAGARLIARLGLLEADLDSKEHKVQTAMGKVETLRVDKGGSAGGSQCWDGGRGVSA